MLYCGLKNLSHSFKKKKEKSPIKAGGVGYCLIEYPKDLNAERDIGVFNQRTNYAHGHNEKAQQSPQVGISIN